MRAVSFITSDEAIATLAGSARDLRLLRNWSQRELADRAGVGYASLRRLETGKSIRLTDALRIFEVLGLLGPLVTAAEEIRDQTRRSALTHAPETAGRRHAYPATPQRKNG